MVKQKSVRERGKIRFSRAFQNLTEGDAVAIVTERSKQPSYPKRMQGKTGIVQGKRGRAAVVKIKDINKEKTFIVDPVHLKRIKQLEKKQ